jgi:hypothetical protein
MLDSSNPLSIHLLMDMSTDTSSLPVVRLHVEPLPDFGTSVVFAGISSVVTMISKISSYVACY